MNMLVNLLWEILFCIKIIRMKQVIITIPDNKYLAFLKHVKTKFSDIQITEKKRSQKKDMVEEDSFSETMLLFERSLAEDWLSDEDNRWDEVL